jgi:hypothetical protein
VTTSSFYPRPKIRSLGRSTVTKIGPVHFFFLQLLDTCLPPLQRRDELPLHGSRLREEPDPTPTSAPADTAALCSAAASARIRSRQLAGIWEEERRRRRSGGSEEEAVVSAMSSSSSDPEKLMAKADKLQVSSLYLLTPNPEIPLLVPIRMTSVCS